MADAPFDVLVIDDDDIVPELVAMALHRTGSRYGVLAAEDGAAGLALLRQRQKGGRQTPQLILLDLNMPRMNGFEFLELLRGDTDLQRNVVFVLSTSDTDSDRRRAYDWNVSGFLVKSRLGPQLCELAGLVEAYRKAVMLPN